TLIQYYTSQAAAITGTTPDLGTSHTIPSTGSGSVLWVRVTNPHTLCYTVRSFQLRIIAAPVVAGIPTSMTKCARNLTDNRASFDLNAAIATALGGQDPEEYRVSFHTSLNNANNNAGVISYNASGMT